MKIREKTVLKRNRCKPVPPRCIDEILAEHHKGVEALYERHGPPPKHNIGKPPELLYETCKYSAGTLLAINTLLNARLKKYEPKLSFVRLETVSVLQLGPGDESTMKDLKKVFTHLAQACNNCSKELVVLVDLTGSSDRDIVYKDLMNWPYFRELKEETQRKKELYIEPDLDGALSMVLYGLKDILASDTRIQELLCVDSDIVVIWAFYRPYSAEYQNWLLESSS